MGGLGYAAAAAWNRRTTATPRPRGWPATASRAVPRARRTIRARRSVTT